MFFFQRGSKKEKRAEVKRVTRTFWMGRMRVAIKKI